MDWKRFHTIDAHAEGEPLRVVTSGVDPLPGNTILEKRRYAQGNLDGLRRVLMFEPRGHADMYGAILTEPVGRGSDFGVLFMHNEGWSTMCGHGIIALSTVAIETGIVPARTNLKIDTPAGPIAVHTQISSSTTTGVRVRSVAFENVPSFVYALDEIIELKGIGRVRYDIAFGGAFYAFVNASDFGIDLSAHDLNRLIEYGMMVKRGVMDSIEVRHPFEDDLSFLYGTIFVGPAVSSVAHSRNVCIFANGEVDRSPTGTGVSARLALETMHGKLKQGQPFIVESILGTRFTGKVRGTTKLGEYDAVIPQIEGRAWITGRHEFLISPGDPLKEGFILR